MLVTDEAVVCFVVAGHTEVDEFRHETAVWGLHHHDVLGLEIAVDDAVVVGVADRPAELPGEVGDPADGQPGTILIGDVGWTDYEEINLSFGYKWLTIDAAIGTYDAPPPDANCNPTIPPSGCSPSTSDYQFYSATVAHNGFWGQYGTFQDSIEGDYVQFGYDFSLAEIDMGVSVLLTDDNAVGQEEEALIVTIGKSFDL